MTAKYAALSALLTQRGDKRVSLTWAALNRIVDGLPAAAGDSEWWFGDRPHVHVWERSGYRLEHILPGRQAVFLRAAEAPLQAPPVRAAAPAPYPPGYPVPGGYPSGPPTLGGPGTTGQPYGPGGWCPPGSTRPPQRLAGAWLRLGAGLLNASLFVVTAGVGYLVWTFLLYGSGQTPAFQLIGLRVVTGPSGTVPTWWHMFVRNMLCYAGLSFLTTIWLIVGAAFACADGNQALWDKMTHTYVIED